MSKQYGFIGLGNMGLPIAKNIAAAGIKLCATDLSPAACEEAAAAGIVIYNSAKEVAQHSDVIITMLPADQHIISVFEGVDGVIANAKSGTVCIDMTSAKGETMRRVAAYAEQQGTQIKWLDAPVSGGVAAATGGTLTIMVAGDETLFHEYKPYFEVVGKKITYTGALGSAKDIKMLNQVLNAGNSAVAAEVIMMAKQLGVDLQTFMDIVNDSSGASWIFKNNVPRYVEHNHVPGFKLDLMKKDVSLFIESARTKGDFTPVVDMVMNVLTAASNQGHGDKNYTYISKWMEEQNKM